MSRQHLLPALSEREAVVDAMYRCLIGFDRNDGSMLKSAFAGEDVSIEFTDGDDIQIYDSLSKIRTQLLDHVGPMDTTHRTSNVRVSLEEGAEVATITAYVVAHHCPPGTGKDPYGRKFVVAGEYFIDLVKVEKDGIWRAKKWVMDVLWREGDPFVIERDD